MYVFHKCLYVYVGNIEKVSGVIVSCSPIDLIVRCTAVWNVSIHTYVANVSTYNILYIHMYVSTVHICM